MVPSHLKENQEGPDTVSDITGINAHVEHLQAAASSRVAGLGDQC
jgi:hypothetical protein